MHRLIGTMVICCALALALGSSTALAYDSPQKYGVEVRGGFGQYNMGDVTPGIENLQRNLNAAGIRNTLDEKNTGPLGGFSLLFRPSKHAMWEVGFNALTDVSNKVTSAPDTASGEILMHANEFFVKGNLVATVTDRLHLDFGAGVSYYNAELQIQDNLRGRYNYDADGRAFGLLGTVGLEYLLNKRVGIILQGGGRIANAANFAYEQTPGTRTSLPIINGSRGMEVNLSGGFGSAGLRIYFDKVTQPVDFTR